MNPQTIRQRLGSDDYVEYDYQDVSGEWLNDKIIPQNRDENGEFDSFILARTSIGEQKKAELEYQEKLKTAARNETLANRSKTELLRRMSHDIRTPINVILGMLEIADRNPTDTTLLESCRSKGKAAAEYLLELVNDILTINKVDAGSAEEAESGSAFLLADAVQKLYIVTEERAKARGIKLEPPQISGEQKPLEGNTLYLRQIMMNIIANAVRYSHAGGTVRFSVSQMPSPEKEGFAEVRFVCEDNGIGMSREFQEKMFEPFSQESEAGSSRFGGVGLGLAIVQKLVQRLDGQISVESEKGVGTRFEIILPYKYADKPVEDKTEEREEISLHGLNILLVEDNELNMQIAEYMLTDAGANVIRAYNGREAVGYFVCSAVGAVDAVLTDMTMPGMDGLEETRRIRAMDRADAKTVPIIALTANLFRQDMTACTDAGMTGFLSKPLNVGQLLKMISQQTKKEMVTMSDLQQFYDAIGSELKPVIERLGGNAEITKRFIKKFAADGSFGDLEKALDGNNTQEAFRAAHTLKGICLSLGFGCLYRHAAAVTELLRGGDITAARQAFPALEQEYIRVTGLLRAL